MDISELAKYYGYENDKNMRAILTALDMATPDYIFAYWITKIAKIRTNRNIHVADIVEKLSTLIDNKLVDMREGMTIDNFLEVQTNLVRKKVVTAKEKLPLPDGPRTGYKLSPKGILSPVYLQKTTYFGKPLLQPA